MLPAPFFTEVPHDLGDDAAWWGRDLMQVLLRLRRHQPAEELPRTADDRPVASSGPKRCF